MRVATALETYVEVARTSDLLRHNQVEVARVLEARRGEAALKDAAQVLGPFSGWPLARKRSFARALSLARQR